MYVSVQIPPEAALCEFCCTIYVHATPFLFLQVTVGKNEVTLEFHQSEEAAHCLVEMRFHIPATAQADPDEDRAKVL